MTAPPQFQPYREPLRTTLLRNFAIALVVAFAISRFHPARIPIAFVLALWPALGGHFVELFFLNCLRMRLAPSRALYIITRLATWLAGGALIALAMQLTVQALTPLVAARAPSLLYGAIGFIIIELLVHLVLHQLHLPSLYNTRG